MSGPTPRTYAVRFKDRSDLHDPSAFDYFVRADFACELERELAEQQWLNESAVKRAKELTEELDAEREKVGVLRDACSDLLPSLQHMQHCGACAEDNWSSCEGGRRAEAAMDKARAALAATEETA